MTWIPMSYVVGFLYVQGVKMRGDFTFCWYWGNCWSSLFKLFFLHNIN